MKTFKTLGISLLICAMPALAISQEANDPNNEAAIQVEATIKAKPAVVANELREIGLWGIGIDQAGFKPLESDLWVNSRAENLSILFDKVTSQTKFVPLNQLVHRVLFSGGTAPNANNDIAKKRLMAAAKTGDAETNVQLLSIVPQITQSQYLSAAYAESLFAIGKSDEACALLNESQPETPVRIILELRAICYALNGESAAANVLLDLATNGQIKSANDQWLARAIISLGQESPITSLKYRADNGHFLAISNKLKLDNNALAPQSTASINLLTLSKTASISQNQFQKNAAKTGILTIEEYRSMQNDALAAASNGLDVAISPSGDIEIKPFDGEEITKELLAANDIDDWWVIAQRIGPKLKDIINPNPKAIDVLIDAALANSDIESARRFMASGSQSLPYRNIIMAIIDNSLAPPIIRDALAGPFTTNYPKVKTVADLSILWALGVSHNGREALLDTPNAGGTQLPQNTLMSLDDAAARSAKAEVILTAAILVQSIDAKSVDLSQIGRLLRALKMVGLNEEAKNLGIYSILARRMNFGLAAQNNRQSLPSSSSQSAPKAANPPRQSAVTASTPAPKPEARPARQAPNVPEWRPKVD